MKSIPLVFRVIMFKICLTLLYPFVLLFASDEDRNIYNNELLLPLNQYSSL